LGKVEVFKWGQDERQVAEANIENPWLYEFKIVLESLCPRIGESEI